MISSPDIVLRDLWKQTLAIQHARDDDDFIALGGNSMGMIRMMVAIQRVFDREFDFEEFFRKPTLGVLVALVIQSMTTTT
jgi:acyl carrier protein